MKMKTVKSLFAAAVAAAGLAVFAEPCVEITKAWQANPGSGVVDFTYEVRGLEGVAVPSLIFKIEAKGCAKSAVITNDNVQAGSVTTSVDYKTLLGGVYPNVSVYASLAVVSSALPEDATGTPIGAFGEVMVINVAAGSGEDATYPVTYYKNVDVGAFNCDAYKTHKIALLKVPASKEGYYAVGGLHEGKLSDGSTFPIPADTTKYRFPVERDYYIGIFELTDQQWYYVMGGSTGSGKNAHELIWNNVRFNGGQGRSNQPVADASFFGKLAAKCRDAVTGEAVGGFDLPTEMQWEIAARANSRERAGEYIDTDLQIKPVNTDSDDGVRHDTVQAPTGSEVGTKRPNRWGIHDTVGNQIELTRDEGNSTDFISEDIKVADDYYVGSTDKAVRRGGNGGSGLGDCEPSHRYSSHGKNDNGSGVRICFMKMAAEVPTDANGFDYTTDGVTFLPGDYCVVDLTNGKVTDIPNVRRADMFNTDEYKTTKMAFRYVPEGKFKANFGLAGSSDRVAVDAELSAYWIAIFPTTKAQHATVMGTSSSEKIPASGDGFTWNQFRGGTWDGTSGAPANDTFVAKLNSLVADKCTDKFDISTSLQWERAARAGTRTDYYFGVNQDHQPAPNVSPEIIDPYAWYQGNSGGSLRDVGTKAFNAWGIEAYGNVYCGCLDWIESSIDQSMITKDYAGAATGEKRVARGGDVWGDINSASSIHRYSEKPDVNQGGIGYRLVRMAK